MLNLVSIANPREKESLFSQFDPPTATWVVSDLKSKLELQSRLLKNTPFIAGESLLRASELWKTLLTRTRPDLQLVSCEFMLTLLGKKLAGMDLAWAKAPGAPKAAYDYLGQFMPILAHPEGEEITREWLKENEASEARWGRWFDLSLKLWKELLEEGYTAPAWASGVLVNETALHQIWSRPLFVDLGAALDQVEADLLILLSDFLDVTVLRPDPSWVADYRKTLTAYEIFDRKLNVAKAKSAAQAAELAVSAVPLKKNANESAIHYRKYTTMIAEVKDAVAQTRKWLDQDESITPREIALVAPDIECYWPALASYLEQEGIPCQKNHVRRLHSYPDMTRWLANLRLKSGSFAEADVEISLFDSYGDKPALIDFDRYKTLFSVLYERSDLERVPEVAKSFEIDFSPGQEVSRDEFVGWCLRQLPAEAELQRVESLLKKLFTECPSSLRFELTRWLSYFEQLASKVECRVKDGDPDGIACVNVSAAENLPAKKMVVMGLTESALRESGGTSVLYSDITSLAYHFGFHLASEDQARLEFETRWMTESTGRELILTVPETDFDGAAQAPSWLWVRGAREHQVHDHLTIPSPTRWDELQLSSLETIASNRHWGGIQARYAERTLREDLGTVEPEPFGKGLIESLSPSAVEDYLECPFVFAAKRLFGMSDMKELDLEIDPIRRGSLLHTIFELLTEEPMRFDYNDDDLAAVVEKAKEKSRLQLADQRMWPAMRARMVDLARRFIGFEKEARSEFPETRTIGREDDIAGYLTLNGQLKKSVSPDEIDETLKFVGAIDRLDTDKRGNYALYDYKSSTSGISQSGSWIKNNQVQLLLYAMAVEKGLTIHPAGPVQSAMYYVSKPLSREYGYKVEDVDQGLYDTSDKRKRNRITLKAKQELFAEGEKLAGRAAKGVHEGLFTTTPHDHLYCHECKWSATCRAPHLRV